MITATRYPLEAEYRKYFTEIRKFEPFPATVSYQNVIDFLEWRAGRISGDHRRSMCGGSSQKLHS